MATSYGLFKSRFKKTIANAIYNEILSNTSKYYHFIGKENLWTDFLSPFINSQDPAVGDVPGAPSDNFRYELHVRRDILSVKKISSSDVSYIVPRIDWEYGEIYDMYDDAITETEPTPSGAVRLEDSKFYVLTDEYNVYKCIYNNYGAKSTWKPTGTSANMINSPTSDGYIWKFMYTIPISLRNRFLTVEYMPVTTALRAPFYSDGEIVSYNIINGGTGYNNPILTVTGNGYLKDNPYTIDSVSILEERDSLGNLIRTYPGDGYTIVPTITFAQPTVPSINQELATATCTLTAGGSIDTITLIDNGYGYTGDPVPPTITIDPPVNGAVAYQTSTSYSLGDIIEHDYRFYEVVQAGLTDSTYPTHSSGTVTIGTAQLLYIAEQARLIPVMTQTAAVLEAVLSASGEIIGVNVIDGGIGYTNANITITDNVTGLQVPGSGAEIDVDFSKGNVDTNQASVELSAVFGTIDAIMVVEGGSGYSAATVQVLGDGTGCTATAIIEGGAIVGIKVVTPGSGYTWTDVVINGNGSGAVVRAVMAPIDGHGYNAIDELNAHTLMFYSSFARDINQGMIVTNDYRKAGLLRNITERTTANRYNKNEGSGCVKITGIFDKTKIAYDQLLYQSTAPYKKYRVVEFDDTHILLSVFNNFAINPGDVLVTTTRVVDPVTGKTTEPSTDYNIQVTDVSERDIDQFSGDFLFLTVREPFAPSEEQIITVRTVLTI